MNKDVPPPAIRQAAATPAAETLGRRSLFKLAGTMAAASAVTACRRPVERLVPYRRQVEYSIPGVPYHYASARVEREEVVGIVAEVHENRPTKLEGNTYHPSNAGATDLRTQASIFDLYDPDRAGTVSRRDGSQRVGANPAELARLLDDAASRAARDGGQRLRLLVEPSISPTFHRLLAALMAKLPKARVHTWTPLGTSNARAGSKLAFGQTLAAVYDLSSARAILAVDADLLQTEPGALRATRGFARGRKLRRPQDGMNRLYVVEPHLTTTGGCADHRLPLPARDVQAYLLAVCRELASKHGFDLAAYGDLAGQVPTEVPPGWVSSVAADLVTNRARSAVIPGARQPAAVHALAHAVNAALGNNGRTIHFYPVLDDTRPEATDDLKQLVADMGGGQVDTLLIVGGNPVYDAPFDLSFAERLTKVATVVHLSARVDETAAVSTWHIPRLHELEAWGDVRAMDGTISVVQPLLAPLHDGMSDIELLAKLAGEKVESGKVLVEATLRQSTQGLLAGGFDRVWNNALQRGVVDWGLVRPVPTTPPSPATIVAALQDKRGRKPLGPDNLEVNFLPDARLLDGRHANNPWLLELPEPISKVVWDNAAYLSPATAASLGLQTGDLVRIGRGGGPSLEVAAFVLPGVADHTVSLHLGWGRQAAGRYGGLPERAGDERTGTPGGVYPFSHKAPHDGGPRGFNAYAIRSSDALAFGDGFRLSKTGKSYRLVTAHGHQSMEGRAIALEATFDELVKTPDLAQWRSPDPKVLPLWAPQTYPDHKWGMSIDLTSCTGCNACVVACQAENNIPFVGKDEVSRGRDMFWVRVDRYFTGDAEKNPRSVFQPVACVQCEQAPCENVCPVNATVHSPEGLNDMAYNRCVGTRYCANNCPYKVRRFNYLEFQGDPLYGDLPETVKMQFNPNVTVRMRGVMEKCTYCVQRIEAARIAARRDGRPLKDGDIVTACAQACPAEAVVFGDLNDPRSRVAELSAAGRSYRLLSELGTHPRTAHLAKIRNPNADMA